MLNKKNATLSYAVMEPNTYLVAAVDEQALVEYCVTMGERNRIPGLLPMHHQIINGEYLLYFDITGKRKLKDVVGVDRLGIREGKKVLESLVRGLQGLSEYYLRPGMCLLDMDVLFVDDHYNPYLPLIPMTGDTAGSDPAVREFLMVMLGETCIGDGTDPYFDQALKRLLPSTFRLEEFAEAMFPAKLAERPVSAGGGASYAPPARQDYVPPAPPRPAPPAPPVPPVEEKPVKVGIKLPSIGKKREAEPETPAPVADPGFAIPGQKFPIPGQKDAGKKIPAVPMPEPADKKGKDKKKKEKEEKSSGGLFGFIGKKKETEAPIPVPRGDIYQRPVPPAPVPTPAPRPAPAPTPAPAPAGDWSGTVQLVNNGATVFMGAGASRTACLIHDGRRIELNSMPFTVGRQACSYIINSGKVSRTHLTMEMHNGAYYVKDENSSNHTYLNDVMLPPYTATPVRDGDTLRLGDVILTLELPTE